MAVFPTPTCLSLKNFGLVKLRKLKFSGESFGLDIWWDWSSNLEMNGEFTT